MTRINVAKLGRPAPELLICDVHDLDVDPLAVLRRLRFVLPACIVVVYTTRLEHRGAGYVSIIAHVLQCTQPPLAFCVNCGPCGFTRQNVLQRVSTLDGTALGADLRIGDVPRPPIFIKNRAAIERGR